MDSLRLMRDNSDPVTLDVSRARAQTAIGNTTRASRAWCLRNEGGRDQHGGSDGSLFPCDRRARQRRRLLSRARRSETVRIHSYRRRGRSLARQEGAQRQSLGRHVEDQPTRASAGTLKRNDRSLFRDARRPRGLGKEERRGAGEIHWRDSQGDRSRHHGGDPAGRQRPLGFQDQPRGAAVRLWLQGGGLRRDGRPSCSGQTERSPQELSDPGPRP